MDNSHKIDKDAGRACFTIHNATDPWQMWNDEAEEWTKLQRMQSLLTQEWMTDDVKDENIVTFLQRRSLGFQIRAVYTRRYQQVKCFMRQTEQACSPSSPATRVHQQEGSDGGAFHDLEMAEPASDDSSSDGLQDMDMSVSELTERSADDVHQVVQVAVTETSDYTSDDGNQDMWSIVSENSQSSDNDRENREMAEPALNDSSRNVVHGVEMADSAPADHSSVDLQELEAAEVHEDIARGLQPTMHSVGSRLTAWLVSQGHPPKNRRLKPPSCLESKFAEHRLPLNLPGRAALQARMEEREILSKPVHYQKIEGITSSSRSSFLLACSADGSLLASCHSDRTVRISCVASGRVVATLGGHARTTWSVVFHPRDRDLLATGCLGGEVRVWYKGDLLSRWEVPGACTICSLSFHPSEDTLAIATGPSIYFWDDYRVPLTTGEGDQPGARRGTWPRGVFSPTYGEMARYVKFSPCGLYLLTGILNPPKLDLNHFAWLWKTHDQLYDFHKANQKMTPDCFSRSMNVTRPHQPSRSIVSAAATVHDDTHHAEVESDPSLLSGSSLRCRLPHLFLNTSPFLEGTWANSAVRHSTGTRDSELALSMQCVVKEAASRSKTLNQLSKEVLDSYETYHSRCDALFGDGDGLSEGKLCPLVARAGRHMLREDSRMLRENGRSLGRGVCLSALHRHRQHWLRSSTVVESGDGCNPSRSRRHSKHCMSDNSSVATEVLTVENSEPEYLFDGLRAANLQLGQLDYFLQRSQQLYSREGMYGITFSNRPQGVDIKRLYRDMIPYLGHFLAPPSPACDTAHLRSLPHCFLWSSLPHLKKHSVLWREVCTNMVSRLKVEKTLRLLDDRYSEHSNVHVDSEKSNVRDQSGLPDASPAVLKRLPAAAGVYKYVPLAAQVKPEQALQRLEVSTVSLYKQNMTTFEIDMSKMLDANENIHLFNPSDSCFPESLVGESSRSCDGVARAEPARTHEGDATAAVAFAAFAAPAAIPHPFTEAGAAAAAIPHPFTEAGAAAATIPHSFTVAEQVRQAAASTASTLAAGAVEGGAGSPVSAAHSKREALCLEANGAKPTELRNIIELILQEQPDFQANLDIAMGYRARSHLTIGEEMADREREGRLERCLEEHRSDQKKLYRFIEKIASTQPPTNELLERVSREFDLHSCLPRSCGGYYSDLVSALEQFAAGALSPERRQHFRAERIAQCIHDIQRLLVDILPIEDFAAVMNGDPLSVLSWLGIRPNSATPSNTLRGSLLFKAYPKFEDLPASCLAVSREVVLTASLQQACTHCYCPVAVFSTVILGQLFLQQNLSLFNQGLTQHQGFGFSEDQFLSMQHLLSSTYQSCDFVRSIHLLFSPGYRFSPLTELWCTVLQSEAYEASRLVLEVHLYQLLGSMAKRTGKTQLMVGGNFNPKYFDYLFRSPVSLPVLDLVSKMRINLPWQQQETVRRLAGEFRILPLLEEQGGNRRAEPMRNHEEPAVQVVGEGAAGLCVASLGQHMYDPEASLHLRHHGHADLYYHEVQPTLREDSLFAGDDSGPRSTVDLGALDQRWAEEVQRLLRPKLSHQLQHLQWGSGDGSCVPSALRLLRHNLEALEELLQPQLFAAFTFFMKPRRTFYRALHVRRMWLDADRYFISRERLESSRLQGTRYPAPREDPDPEHLEHFPLPPHPILRGYSRSSPPPRLPPKLTEYDKKNISARIQLWRYHRDSLPDITDRSAHVVVPAACVLNDNSIAVSKDWRRLAVFISRGSSMAKSEPLLGVVKLLGEWGPDARADATAGATAGAAAGATAGATADATAGAATAVSPPATSAATPPPAVPPSLGRAPPLLLHSALVRRSAVSVAFTGSGAHLLLGYTRERHDAPQVLCEVLALQPGGRLATLRRVGNFTPRWDQADDREDRVDITPNSLTWLPGRGNSFAVARNNGEVLVLDFD